ncbi:MAG TPA: DUF3455 domain-containing protein [Caldilineaceae bacterium]|mgnify:CR=1 FL=1|nr:DUF3455 domain-containing protein [Caldilineaceae bacterium]
MKYWIVAEKQKMRSNLLWGCAIALALAFMAALPQPAYADSITPPPLPADLAPVPAGNKLFLGTHAVGTQNYVCKPSGAGVAYVLFTPEATLFGEDGGQAITHFFSPNPFEPNTDPKVVADGTIRATWQYRDTSRVWAKVHATEQNGKKGAVTVDPKAIAWLLLDGVGSQNGPTGGDKLTGTTFVQRLNTVGGLAPSTGCASSTDVGNQAFVPYTADYFFYKKAD